MPQSGLRAIPLCADDKVELVQLNRLLAPHYWKPRMISDVYADKALAELTLLCLCNLSWSNERVRRNHDLVTLEKVEDWIQMHLTEPATVSSAAHAAGISESSLFRLFREVRAISPQQAILKLKIDRATELVAENGSKLHFIAQQSGFSNASALCRAFKAVKGCTPKAWQREIFIQYKRPPESMVENYKMHGERRRPE